MLDEPQLALLERFGARERVEVGDVLYAVGEESHDLIVLLDCEVQVIDRFGQPDELVVITLGPHEFLGEIGLLSVQRAYMTALVCTGGHVLRVAPEDLFAIMGQEPELSELFLRAFLVRHSGLTRLGSGLTLVGSRLDPDTRRLQEVMLRNRLSTRWLDLEMDPAAALLLRRLDISPEELPIVLVPGGPLLRNPSTRGLVDALGLAAPHTETDPSDVCDLPVVGGGPAGLSAAVYSASEGLLTTLAEDTAVGGQAGTSSRIENYLGFFPPGSRVRSSQPEQHCRLRNLESA